MSDFSVEFVPREIIDPATGSIAIIYQSIIDILIVGTNRSPNRISCLIDTGADFNIFPTEVAIHGLGMSEKTLRKGKELPLRGIGDISPKGRIYGHRVSLRHPYFKFKTWVYFLDRQYPPLLGRNGFMDKFSRIIFDEKNRKTIFTCR